MMAEFVFTAMAIRRTGTLVKIEKPVSSGRNGTLLCHSFQLVVLHGSICKHDHTSLVSIILESNSTSVKRTINIFRTNVGFVINHVKFRSCSAQTQSNFQICRAQFSGGENVNPQFTLDCTAIVSTKHSLPLFRKRIRQGASVI